jgi:hypothetical protein
MNRRSIYNLPTQPLSTLSNRIQPNAFNEENVVINRNLNINSSNIVSGDSLNLPIGSDISSNVSVSCLEFSTLRLNIDNTQNPGVDLDAFVYFRNGKTDSPWFKGGSKKVKGGSIFSDNIPIRSKYVKLEVLNNSSSNASNINVFSALSKYHQYEAGNQLGNTYNQFEFVNLTKAGNDWRNDVILGLYDGCQKINIAGQFESLIASNSQLFANSTNPYTIMNTPDTFDISSSLAADRGISIHIEGITTGGLVQEEDIDLDAIDATTPVTTFNTYIRINKMFVNDIPFNAPNTQNVGDISAFSSTSGYFMEIIPATYNQSQTAKYCVPSGKTLVIKNFNLIGSLSNHNPTIIFHRYTNVFGGLDYIIKKIRFDDWQGIQTQDDLDYLFKENEEFYITVDTVAGTPQADYLTIQLEAYLYENISAFHYF